MKDRHPDKEIDAAVKHALGKGWILTKASGHAWGILRCPHHDDECRCGQFCQMSVWSTPRSAGNHARTLRKKVDGCIHDGNDDDE